MNKTQPGEYDAIIVLGAHVKPEGVPSEALRRRLTLALAHYQDRRAPIVCCGAQGSDEPEAEGDFMCRWLAEHTAARRNISSAKTAPVIRWKTSALPSRCWRRAG